MANSNALIHHVPLKMNTYGSFTLYHMCSLEVFCVTLHSSCRATLKSALVPMYQQVNNSRVNIQFLKVHQVA